MCYPWRSGITRNTCPYTYCHLLYYSYHMLKTFSIITITIDITIKKIIIIIILNATAVSTVLLYIRSEQIR